MLTNSFFCCVPNTQSRWTVRGSLGSSWTRKTVQISTRAKRTRGCEGVVRARVALLLVF